MGHSTPHPLSGPLAVLGPCPKPAKTVPVLADPGSHPVLGRTRRLPHPRKKTDLALIASFGASSVGRNAILDLCSSTNESSIIYQHQPIAELHHR